MTRRILLTLADDTTATECVSCPIRKPSLSPHHAVCEEFGRLTEISSRGFVQRHPECLAAERAEADLARVTAERDETSAECATLRTEHVRLRSAANVAEKRAEEAERERDEERHLATVRGEMLTQVERERDARPDISAEDCAVHLQWLSWPVAQSEPVAMRNAVHRIDDALREHAKRAKVGDDA